MRTTGRPFSKSFSLDLSAASWVSGSLKTGRNAIGSFLPSVDVQSVQLSGPGGSLAWNEVLASDPGSAGFEIWSFGTHWLEAGTWTLTVNGMAYSDKSEEGFRGEFTVPEPASAAVLSVALFGAAAAPPPSPVTRSNLRMLGMKSMKLHSLCIALVAALCQCSAGRLDGQHLLAGQGPDGLQLTAFDDSYRRPAPVVTTSYRTTALKHQQRQPRKLHRVLHRAG